ncbi:MAG: hypothetical protein VB140_07295 [Burkholderia sp.]|nr:MAG: hypothetical protein E5299_00613 [Burkholderia gladioli]
MRVLLHDQMPDQMKILFALWTQHPVLGLIRYQCSLMLMLQGIGLYLECWGFTLY